MSATGNVVAVGSSGYDVNGNSVDAGQLRIFEWSSLNNDWNQRGNSIVGVAAGDQAGRSVALSADGSVLVVGADEHDGPNGPASGQARVFAWNGVEWAQRGSTLFGESSGDEYGYAVSLNSDGMVVAVGGYNNAGAAGFFGGHVRVFEWDGNDWRQRGVDLDGAVLFGRFGGSVSLSSDGSILAAGGYSLSSPGKCRIFRWTSTAWIQLGGDMDGRSVSDGFGISVSLSNDGSVVAVGAHNDDNENGANAGLCRVFQFDGSTWNQKGQTINGEVASDWSGYSVALSGNGDIVIIGAGFNDGNGANSGHARVYEYVATSSIWVQLGQSLVGKAAGDGFGWSVGISDDGSRVIGGAPEDNGVDAGHAVVYQLMSST